jgi:16S rRNA (cytosine967-C5)-methyltransferase
VTGRGEAATSGRARGVRAAAAAVVERTLAAHAPADALLAAAAASFDDRDGRLLGELVYGTLRWLRRLDHVIGSAAARPVEKIDAPLLSVLRIGALQLLTLDRVPAHAAVSEAVDEARHRRGVAAAGFVNAVLRRIASASSWEAWPVAIPDAMSRLAVESSHPDRLVARWWRRFGEERTRAMVAADNGPRPLHLLGFASRGGRVELARALAAEGVATRASEVAPTGLVVLSGEPLASRAFARGDFYVQDEASQAAAQVPAPRSGERILDPAAAPGGKGLALLAREPGARVLFSDRSPARLARLRRNLERLGLECTLTIADAGLPPWPPRFDRVVLDAPCSGTGTLRRHPELRWRFREEELARLAAESARMFAALAACVAPGGLLQLVTCSIEREENEEVVASFLERHRRFERQPLDSASCPPSDAGDLAGGFWRLLPGAGHDGFSVHVLRHRP